MSIYERFDEEVSITLHMTVENWLLLMFLDHFSVQTEDMILSAIGVTEQEYDGWYQFEQRRRNDE